MDKPSPNDPANSGKHVVESEPDRKEKRVSISMDSYAPPKDVRDFISGMPLAPTVSMITLITMIPMAKFFYLIVSLTLM
ncbi:hypothetical protein [Endozoicomonas atrinae]|uniref:hypothetical protein n=1 Tax=Endozoicomonas atrinae TaxID=1333660 RepID=UPI0008271486|nr:hypothetical protein [Endozoicomonas atrinae]